MTDARPVLQLRLVVEAEDYDEAVRFYRDVLGLPEEAAFQGDGGARVAILGCGRATLEIANPAQKRMIDEVEVGRQVAPRLRVAFEVADTAAVTAELVAGGAELVAPPTVTPWRSLNARFDAPAGLHITLFQEHQGGAQTFLAASAAAYDAHVGRYGPELAQELLAFAGVVDGDRVLDVGCGTGLLTAEMAAVVGGERVCAVDPSEPFVDACRRRVPAADVRLAAAEDLPFADAGFDRVLSQLVVNFMVDARAGVREMRRVTRPGGTVAACVWDYGGEMTLLRTFWEAAAALDDAAAPLAEATSMPHCERDSLVPLWAEAGLEDIRSTELRPSVRYAGFDELWAPLTTGVAPSGAYTVSLDEEHREALRQELFRRLGSPAGPFVLSARAWAVAGRR
jgi:SAM-dependent methyltransferase/predicted enzyme related to lactoylglutathione lyase